MSGKRPGDKPKKKNVDPEKAAAKRERRAVAKAEREAQARKERRKRVFLQVGILAAVIVVAIAVTIAIMKANEPDYVAAPDGFNEDGAIAVGNANAPVTVTLVEDFQCPFCAATHEDTKDLLTEYAEGDEVRLEYRPIAFLDEMSSTEYSSRALNAAVCVAGDDPDNWMAMHDTLMENQPAEGSSGLPDSTLTEMAVAAGADEATVSACIDDRDHEGWIDYTTDRVQDEDDFEGTPAIYVNGDRIESTRDALDEAVQEALAS